MMQQYFLLVFILVFSAFSQSFAQDTLWLLNGEKLILSNYKFIESGNFFQYENQKGKIKEIDGEFIFSITDNNGSEKIYYKPDTIEGNFYTTEQMRSFVTGGYDARIKYKSPVLTISGFIVGAGSIFIMPGIGLPLFYSPLIPAVYSTIAGFTAPSKKTIISNNPQYSKDQYYIKGYQEAVANKRVKNTIIGTGLGVLVGIISYSVIEKQQN